LRWLDIRATFATATLIVVIVVVINGRLWMAIHVCSPPVGSRPDRRFHFERSAFALASGSDFTGC
jgi:hypothetical protein